MVKHEADYDYIRPVKFGYLTGLVAPSVIFAGFFVLYFRTMAPSLFWGDSAAFAATNHTLGLPHSPSFPLYTLLGRLFGQFPNMAPAFSSSLMSAFFAALAVAFFYLIAIIFFDVPVYRPSVLSSRLQSPGETYMQENEGKAGKQAIDVEPNPASIYMLLPALAITALFGLTLPVWLSAVRAEVYSLHLFITLAAIYLTFRGVRDNKRRQFLFGIWLYALSYTNHPLLALGFAPAFLYLIVLHLSTTCQKLRTLGVIASFFVLAFSVYLFLPIRSALDPAINWGRPDNADSFFAAITRSSDMANFTDMTIAPDYLIRLRDVGFFLAGQIGWPFIGLIIFGLWGVLKISKKLFLFFPLAILCNLAVVLWAADFDARNYDLVNYLAPLTGVILIVSGAGVLYLLRMKIDVNRAAPLMTVLVGIFLYFAAVDNSPQADLSLITGPDQISREITKELPAGSVLLVAEDDLLLPMWYRAYVDKTARQIAVLSPGAMVNPAYRKQLAINYPELKYPDDFTNSLPGKPDSLAAQLCRLNAPERGVYLQFGVPGISHTEIIPSGILFKYVGDSGQTTIDSEIYKKHLELAEMMLRGNSMEARTVDFLGRWIFTLGVYYQRIGNNELAWELFNRALNIDQGSIDLRYNLAKALAKAKMYKEALKYLSDALEIDSQNQKCLDLGQQIIRAIESQKAVVIK